MPGTSTLQTNSGQGTTLQGKVYGGQQPIVGASVYLYAANTTGYGSASVSLLNNVAGTSQDASGNYFVATDGSGNFSITGDYTCPGANSQVYLYSVGGNPGAGGTNSAAGLLAGLGTCGNLTSSTFVMVNEVSTVATAYAIAGYATDATHVSSSSSTLGLTGIANAFAAVPNLEAQGTGLALAATPAGNGTVPQSEINTLADILAGCVNSAGPGSSACSTLLSSATNGSGTQPTDTAAAAINIAHNPGANIATLYGLATASAPFQPTLGVQPNDFTIAVEYTGGALNSPWGVAVDASGNVWVANRGSATVSKFSPVGAVLSGTNGYTGGGVNAPIGIAIDGSGNAWTANYGNSSVSELNSSGVPQSGSGFTGGGVSSPYGIAIDASSHVWISNSSTALSEFSNSGSPISSSGYTGGGVNASYGVAIDSSGNVWTANNGANSLSEFNSSGVAQSGPTGFTGGGVNQPEAVAVDGFGNVWSTSGSNNSLIELNSSGVALSVGSGFTGGGLSAPRGVAVDGSGNLWVANDIGNDVSEFNSSGAAITGSGGYQGGGLDAPFGIAIDGSGNVWLTSYSGNRLTQFVGAATPVVTPIVANLLPPYGGRAVNQPFYNSLALPAPNPSSLPSAIVSQAYTGSVIASGGTAPFNWTVKGVAVPTNGTLVSIEDGLSASNNGSNVLSVTGTPTSATPSGNPVSFSAQVKDASSNVAGPDAYTILVSASGSGQISGQFNLTNNNCSNLALPTFTVTLTNTATNQAIQTTTSNGHFAFTGLPAATYNITPSISGATSSIFSPASYTGVVVTSSTNQTGENFGAAVAYTVSGTATYSGATAAGQIYMVLSNNSCGGSFGAPGTSVAYPFTAGGAYSIRGVPPGSYTLQAWMDPSTLAQGAVNSVDPTGTAAVTVNNASATGQSIVLTDPTVTAPASNPQINAITPNTGGVTISYNPVNNNVNGGKVEQATLYDINWSTNAALSSTGGPFTTVTGTKTFKAIGNGANVWILDNTVLGSSAFTGVNPFFFQARARNSAGAASGWATFGGSTPTGVIIGTPSCPGTCYSISGAVTIPSSLTLNTGAPLYIGVYNENTGQVYVSQITSPTQGTGSPNSYTISNVPSGNGYGFFYIIDQNNDGLIDAGDLTNTRNKDLAALSVTGDLIGQDLAVSTANSAAQVQTGYVTCSSCTLSYSVQLEITEGNKLPVAVTLSATTGNPAYLLTPVDFSLCTSCGNDQFDYTANLPGGTPNVGDSFNFTVTYSDGSQDTGTAVNGAVTAFGSTGAIVGASDVATSLQTTAGTAPNFTWTFPANPGNYTYQFNLSQTNNCSGNSCEIWQIPGNNSNSNGFTYAQTETGATTGQITWGTDPTGGSSTPSGSLNASDDYMWTITVFDSNNNSAQSSANDNTP